MATLPGVYRGIVLENVDPQNQARVHVRLAGVTATGTTDLWARVVTLAAGDGRGLFCLPEIGDEVIVAFERGDPSAPCLLGATWGARTRPPADAASRLKVLKSTTGVTVRITDDKASPSITIETPAGQRITLRDGPGSIDVADSNGNRLTLAAAGVTITAAASVTVQASAVHLSAGTLTVDAGLTRFNGVVQCDTLISNAVVSASYSPGAGNIA